MNVYICSRGNSYWMGALIIAAKNKQQAIDIYAKHEREEKSIPFSIERMGNVEFTGDKPQVLYDDDAR